MALLQTKIGRCKNCNQYGPMTFMNHRQSQQYCEICQPIVDKEEIHKAILLLKSHNVTAEMWAEFIEPKKESK